MMNAPDNDKKSDKYCQYCGRRMGRGRAGRRDYCSNACRQAAYRERVTKRITVTSVTEGEHDTPA